MLPSVNHLLKRFTVLLNNCSQPALSLKVAISISGPESTKAFFPQMYQSNRLYVSPQTMSQSPQE